MRSIILEEYESEGCAVVLEVAEVLWEALWIHR